MKTFKQQLVLLSLIVLAGIGCSKKETKTKGPEPVPVPAPPTTGGNGGNQSPGSGGATANLTVISQARLEEYAGRRISGPTNIQINVDLRDVSSVDDRFGGSIRISYVENGRTITGTFNSGNSMCDTRFNKWYNHSGRSKFKAMFQDNLGAIILMIEDETNDLGTFRGRVFFRNFDFSVCSNPPPWLPPMCNTQSPQKCWNITTGPYDCRAFMGTQNAKPTSIDNCEFNLDSKMRPDQVEFPGFGSTPDGYNGPGYQELGTFDNLDLRKALNLN